MSRKFGENNFRDLPERLSRRLNKPLPGRAAQRRFVPSLSYGRHFAPPDTPPRAAAVLVFLYQSDNEWRLPLIRRPLHLSDHPGQIALPGGASSRDESPEETALRETHEELGVCPATAVLGRLTPIYVFNSNFLVTPCVTAAYDRPAWQPSAAEVSDLIELPLDELVRPENVRPHTLAYPSPSQPACPVGEIAVAGAPSAWHFSAPSINWKGYHIWGATAIILGELIAVLEEVATASASHG